MSAHLFGKVKDSSGATRMNAELTAKNIKEETMQDATVIKRTELNSDGTLGEQILITSSTEIKDDPAPIIPQNGSADIYKERSCYKYIMDKIMNNYISKSMKKMFKGKIVLFANELINIIKILLPDSVVEIINDDTVSTISGCGCTCDVLMYPIKILVDGKDFEIEHNESFIMLEKRMKLSMSYIRKL